MAKRQGKGRRVLQLTSADAAYDPRPVTGIGLSDSTASGSPPAPMSLPGLQV